MKTRMPFDLFPDFLPSSLLSSASSSRTVVATGGGSYKYFDLLSSKLGVEVERWVEREARRGIAD